MADTQALDDILAFIEKTWPDLAIDPERIEGWVPRSRRGDGRAAENIRSDIIKNVITDERVDEFVAEAFSDRGIDPKTGDESSGRTGAACLRRDPIR